MDKETNLEWGISLKKQLKKVFRWDDFNQQEAKRRLDAKLFSNDKSLRIKSAQMVWLRAAILVLAFISGAVFHYLSVSKTDNEISYNEIIVPMGQMTQVNLSDGSKMWLNSGSALKYPTKFGDGRREIYIDGEAFMEIAPDKQAPFIVKTAKFTVQVLGTSFNLSAYSGDKLAVITLVEGKILLNGTNHEWNKNMFPGQSAIVENGQAPKVSNVDTGFYTTWKEGRIVFRKETLDNIAKKMERWYNVNIVFEDENLKKLTFSGTFLKYKPVEQVFKSLSILDRRIDIKAESKADQKDIIYIIKRNN